MIGKILISAPVQQEQNNTIVGTGHRYRIQVLLRVLLLFDQGAVEPPSQRTNFNTTLDRAGGRTYYRKTRAQTSLLYEYSVDFSRRKRCIIIIEALGTRE